MKQRRVFYDLVADRLKMTGSKALTGSELDKMSFTVTETGETISAPSELRLIVFITSNFGDRGT